MRVHLWPQFSGEDLGDGGVRQVVDGQMRTLPRYGVDFVEDPGDADLIACHIQVPSQYLNRFPDKPLVVHNHGLYWRDYEWQPWAYKANREVLKALCAADVSTAPTEWVADVIRRHTSRDVRVVPHGVDMRAWQPAGNHKGYVLWNKTRVDPICETDTLDLLVKMMPTVPFVSTFAGIESPNLVLTGKMPFEQSKELVRHAAVYLCTSRETFGVGTLEAMASGVPVVGYRFGGQAEYVRHKVDGYLAERGDLEDLKRGVEWAYENRATAAVAARETAKRFTWQAAAEQYKDIYRDVLDQHEARARGPRVTIVVPAYNLEQYLPDTLQSIKNQTDKNWECVVVDDASPDACGTIADEWAKKDKRFRVIHNATNMYLAEARNIAIDTAKGRYILPVDADDMIAPNTVQTLADALDSDRTLQSVYGNVLFTEEDGHTPRDYRVNGNAPGYSGWPMKMDPWGQVEGKNFQPYCSMYRRTAWEQLGGYRRRLRTAEDADFWTRMQSYGFRSEMVTEAATLIYRNREGSMSRINDKQRYEYLRWFPWSKRADLAPAGLAGENEVALLTPHISVVIPVGPGHGRYVQDAIDSVMSQSYPYWECIVVNDSGEPLTRLPAWAKQVTTDARDTGAARNAGLAIAQGSLFLPLDADDFLQPDALQWLVTAYAQSKGNIVYPDFYEDPDEEGVFKVYNLPDWSCDYLTTRGMPQSVVALYPLSVWREVGGYTTGMGWEDWDFQLKCAKAGYCSIHLPAPLFTYRKHTGARRDYTAEDFERRKLEILERWGDPETGRMNAMGCNCGGGRAAIPAQFTANGAMAAAPEYGDAAMIEYTGGRMGSVQYRGTTGAVYSFGAGDRKWVAGADVDMFLRIRDFKIADSDNGPAESGQALSVLTA